MEARDLQQEVAKFVREHDLDRDATRWLLDLVAEIGELSGECLRETADSAKPIPTDRTWFEELGDVLFALLSLANETGVDIEDALNQALAKYRRRIERHGDPGSGPLG